jgi:Helix-turn-helix domain
LEDRINQLRTELEVLEAHYAVESKVAADARLRQRKGLPLVNLPPGHWYTLEEVAELFGLSRQTVYLKVVKHREFRSLVVRSGKGDNQRKRRMVFVPSDWNREH